MAESLPDEIDTEVVHLFDEGEALLSRAGTPLWIGEVQHHAKESAVHAEPRVIMMQTITATFEDGMLKPTQPLHLPAHAEVRLTIELLPASPLTVEKLNFFLKIFPPWLRMSKNSRTMFARSARNSRRRRTHGIDG